MVDKVVNLAHLNENFIETVDNLFYKKCTEKVVLNKKLTQLLDNHHFVKGLDIGPGPGLLSEPIYKRCQHLILLEILSEYGPMLKKRYPKADVIIESFLKYEFGEKFDIILCSHVLYYFTDEQLEIVLEKLYNYLSTDGFLIIILLDCNFILQYFEREFGKSFGVNFINFDKIYQYFSCRGKTEFIDYYFDKFFYNKLDFTKYIYQFLSIEGNADFQDKVNDVFSHLEKLDDNYLMQQHGKILLFERE